MIVPLSKIANSANVRIAFHSTRSDADYATAKSSEGKKLRRVQQTRFGMGQGNCLLACVASILERPLESIPDFAMSGCGWFEDLYEWCLNESIGLLCVDPKDLDHSICLNSWCILIFTVDAYNCCDGKVPDENHAVIGRCKRIETGHPDAEDAGRWKWEASVEFDPNPKGVKLGNLLHVLFLIPKQGVEESSI